jgi:hypothetical protein
MTSQRISFKSTVAYAELSAHPAQAERQGRVGLQLYSPVSVAIRKALDIGLFVELGW